MMSYALYSTSVVIPMHYIIEIYVYVYIWQRKLMENMKDRENNYF